MPTGIDPDRLPLVRALFTDLALRPFMVADGLGVDSTAHLILLKRLGVRPTAILFADVGSEKDETYAYIPVRRDWLARNGFPELTVVKYRVSDYKHWPPYESLAENCLTNGTLPSLAFGFKSCSIKWKIVPQNKWADAWGPAQACWSAGRKVLKAIGYDASAKDRKRYAHAVDVEDPKYDYVYPVMAAGWDRDRCKEVIREEGEPVPPKSACWMCPATQPEELHEHKKKYLRWIVLMEARAAPRLVAIEGLWRNGVKGTRGGKKKPGRMTDYIREHALLPAAEIEAIARDAPKDILDHQAAFAGGVEIPGWETFLAEFADPGDAGCCRPEAEVIQLTVRKQRKAAPCPPTT